MLGTTGCSSEFIDLIAEEISSMSEYQLELTEEETKRKQEIEEAEIYPYYNSLSDKEKEIYLRMCTAIEAYEKEEFVLAVYNTKEECEQATERLGDIYQYLVYEQPQYFWVNTTLCEHVMWTKGNQYLLGMKLDFIMLQEEAEQKKEQLAVTADRIAQEAKLQGGTYEQVLFVYDTLLRNTKYDYAVASGQHSGELERSAYGCLVGTQTVCSGYAMAFNMIMQKLGYLTGVAFDNVNLSENGEGHVWNYARLDGEYYYFDLTWDDTAFESDVCNRYFGYGHQFFGITKAELPHTVMKEEHIPECNGTRYNYYVYNGLNMATYDFATAKEMIQRQADQGYAVLRFDSHEQLRRAQVDLIDNQRIYDIFPYLNSISYLLADSGLHLYLFF